MTLDKYTVRTTLRQDNPTFPKYQIFLGERLIGTQFSVPCLSDCQWHEAQQGVYAQHEREKSMRYGYSAQTKERRGRKSNAERARRAAALLTEIPA